MITTKNMNQISKYVLVSLILCLPALNGFAQETIRVDLNKSKKVTPVEYGFHYEEIGMIGEGALHAELIRNRGFEEATPPRGVSVRNGLYEVDNPTGNNKKVFHVDPLIGWIATPLAYSPIKIERTLRDPLNEKNPHSMAVNITNDFKSGQENVAIHNRGYYGMYFKKGNTYNLSFYVKSNRYKGNLNFQLSDENGTRVSDVITFPASGREWTKHTAVLTANKDIERGMLSILPDESGMFQLDMISLFPSDTWDNGRSIFRTDIMQNLKDYSPDFIRFPGGCIVHGTNEETMYHWKETIGDIAQRPGAWSKWAPYYRTDGLGYHEFYELCEYLGSDAMYVTPTGMVCTEWVERDENRVFKHIETDVNYYIQDALDAIEYAIGPVTSKWGAERAKNGHPAAFPLKYVEIGNEDFGPVYYEKYDKIYKAIKAKYPDLTLIANSIIFESENDKRKYIPDFKDPKEIEIYDEHYYQTIDWAMKEHYKFDAYDRKGPDLFIGELGINGKYPKRMLAEGIVKLSMERNGDLDPLMADRPLMRNLDFLEGRTTHSLLLNNTTQSLRTFNFYLCKMLRDNKINICYTTTVNHQSGLFATAGRAEQSKDYIIKVINLSDAEQDILLEVPGLKSTKNAVITLLTANEDQIVTAEQPDRVLPQIQEQKVKFPLEGKLPANSFVVYRIKM